jgi:hypothetical protein
MKNSIKVAFTMLSMVAIVLGQPAYIHHSISTTMTGAFSVKAVDMDGDGDMDVLSASERSNINEIAWLENDGSENFTTHTISTELNFLSSVFAIDLDLDGDMDVIYSSQGDNSVSWFENDGSESFLAHTITTNANGARSVYAIDLDDDGDIDLLSASQHDDKIAWYQNDGSDSFTEIAITTNADGAWYVYVIDLDSDGDLDVLSTSLNDNKVAWYQNDGSEGFTEFLITANAQSPRSLFPIDIDGDSDLDIVIPSFDGSGQDQDEISWLENDGSENFVSHIIASESTPINMPYSVHAADFDGDGDIDVLACDVGGGNTGKSDEITWYVNDGSESFNGLIVNNTWNHITNGGTSAFPVSVIAADIDGDGDEDVLSAATNGDLIDWYENMLHSGPTWHVSSTGEDTNEGSLASPFATIQAGINAASDSDTVLVHPGTYVENINFSGKNIILLSEAGANSTTIQSTAGDAIITGATDSTAALIGFTVTSTDLGINAGPGGSTRFEDLIIQNCGNRGINLNDYEGTLKNVRFYNNESAGSGAGASVINTSDVNFINCIFSGNYAGIGGSDAGGGAINGLTSSIVLENCLIYDNYCSVDGGGVAGTGTSVKIFNSTITKNSQGNGRYGAGLAINGGNWEIINTIVQGNYHEGVATQIVLFSGITSVSHSNIGLSISDAEVPNELIYLWSGPGNINEDPLFMDSESNNFSLQIISPCIGAGIDTSSVPDSDIINIARPFPAGSNPDMGVYENSLAVPFHNSHILVSTEGDDVGSLGLESAPFATIQAAIDYSIEGDTVLVLPGTYQENINFNGKNIVVGSLFLTTQDTAHISQTIIDGNQGGSVVTFQSGEDLTAQLTGFTIQNGSGTQGCGNDLFDPNACGGQDFHGGGIVLYESNPTLDHLRITHNVLPNNELIGAPSGTGGGIYVSESTSILRNLTIAYNEAGRGAGMQVLNSNLTVESCNITNNTGWDSGGNPDGDGAGIALRYSNPIISNCLIASNLGTGITCDNGSNPVIIHCTITNNVASQGGGIIFGQASAPSVLNSIIWNNTSWYQPGNNIYGCNGTVTVTHSLVGGGLAEIGGAGDDCFPTVNWGPGNLDVDPLFLNRSDGNYALGDYSPGIGAGLDTTAILQTDIEGNLRPNPAGSNPDMGAFENSLETTLHNSFIHVATTGSDEGSIGLIEAPFASIQAAINYSMNADTVLVQPGTYVENINFNGKNIVVGSLFLTTQDTSYISSTIIDGNQNGPTVSIISGESSSAALLGLSITNGTGTPDGAENDGGGIFVKGASPLLSNLNVYGNSAVHWGAGIVIKNSSSVIEDSWIHDNSIPGEGAGIALSYSSVTIRNSQLSYNICDQRAGALYLSHSTAHCENLLVHNNSAMIGSAFSLEDSELNLTNSTVTKNTGSVAWLYSDGVTFNVTNSILWNENSEEMDLVGSNHVIDIKHSIIEGGWAGTNILDANPLFVNAPNNNYHLSEYSPAIGAALDTIIVPSKDIEGNLRPNPAGSNPDMGAYENSRASAIETLIWSIQLQANQGSYNDLDNFLGVAGSATDGFDNIFDAVEPPPAPGSSITLSFPHPEWNSQLGNYFSSDIRPDVDLSDSLQIWDFEVTSTEDGVASVTLLLENTSAIWPFRIATNEILLTSEYNTDSTAFTFTFNASSNHDHTFSVEIGDTTALIVTSVTSQKENGHYALGDTIPVEVIFAENVLVSGVPTLTLETGVIDAIVDYSRGSGSNTLMFDYVVAAAEMSADLNYHSVSALELNGGTIMDASGEVALLTLPELWGNNSLGGNKNIRIDTQSPSIEHGGEMDGPKIVAANSSQVISWTMSSDVSNVGVYFSSDSGQTYSMINSLDGGVTSWQWQIPDSNLIFGGKLKFVADDSAGNASDAYSDYVFTIVGDSLAAPVNAGWTLWGAPLNPYTDTMEVNLADDFTEYWTTYDYVNYGYTYDGFLQQGEGYWLGAFENATIDILGSPSTTDMEIPLSLGWDLLSNPLILDVSTDSLIIINTNTQDTLLFPDAVNAGLVNSIYMYDGNGYSEPSILKPWHGYWFSVLSDNLIAKFPVHRHDQVVAARDIREEGWNLQIFASTDNGAEDNLLTIGTHPEATDEFDSSLDEVRPPTSPGPRNVQLDILHPEWELPLGDAFVRDIRAENIDDLNEDWLISASSSETEITLNWDVSQVPEPLEIGIDINGDNIFEDLTELESLTISAGTEFTVRVGANALSADNMTMPTEYLLVQNYPNPFNPSTTIKYGLPEKSQVSLIIYDLRGSEIIRLVKQSQEAGWYNYNWKGVDKYGHAVPTGMYFARLQAGAYSQTIKMLYLK